jgi:hypothetical protein
MFGMGGPHGHHGGGGGGHHGGGGHGRQRVVYGTPGPWFYGYPEPLYDCVRDPLDLRRCLPPPSAYAGFGDFYEDNKFIIHIGVVAAIAYLIKKAK